MYFKFLIFGLFVTACVILSSYLSLQVKLIKSGIQSYVQNAINLNDPAFISASTICGTENEIDTAFIQKYQTGDSFDITLLAQKKFRCFVKCLHAKMGLTNDKGEPNREAIKKYFEIDDAEINKYSKCFTENTDTDPCDKAFNVQLCVIKQIK